MDRRSSRPRERERTGIGSLKVRYNQVFGYYIEVTKPNLQQVPADYIRKQTLVERRALRHAGAEGVRGARSSAPRRSARALEYELFSELGAEVAAQQPR